MVRQPRWSNGGLTRGHPIDSAGTVPEGYLARALPNIRRAATGFVGLHKYRTIASNLYER
jgi:hypothetical protein